MGTQLRKRFWVEVVFASLCGLLTLLTVFVHDWVEVFTGWDPDQHRGYLEWGLVIGLALASVVVGFVARREWNNTRTTAVAAA
jgi:hypothetical protein